MAGDEHRSVMMAEAVGKRLDHFCKYRIVDGWNDQSNGAGKAIVQRTGHAVAYVTQVSCCSFNSSAGRDAYDFGLVIRPGNSGC